MPATQATTDETTVRVSRRHRQMLEAMRVVTEADGVRVRDVKETVEDCIERAFFASGKQRRAAKKGEQ